MSLTWRIKNKLFDTVMTSFDKIGRANSTAMPSSKRNGEPAAWELMMADELRRRANKRREAALDAAIDAGLIPATMIEPDGPIAKEECWRGEHVSITGMVIEKKGRMDMDKFIAALKKNKVSEKVIDAALEAATGPKQLQRNFEAVPIVVD